jgi:hypothetical protein
LPLYLLQAVLVTVKTITVLSEAIDNIHKMNPTNPIETAKATSLFIGLSAVWFLTMVLYCKFTFHFNNW